MIIPPLLRWQVIFCEIVMLGPLRFLRPTSSCKTDHQIFESVKCLSDFACYNVAKSNTDAESVFGDKLLLPLCELDTWSMVFRDVQPTTVRRGECATFSSSCDYSPSAKSATAERKFGRGRSGIWPTFDRSVGRGFLRCTDRNGAGRPQQQLQRLLHASAVANENQAPARGLDAIAVCVARMPAKSRTPGLRETEPRGPTPHREAAHLPALCCQRRRTSTGIDRRDAVMHDHDIRRHSSLHHADDRSQAATMAMAANRDLRKLRRQLLGDCRRVVRRAIVDNHHFKLRCEFAGQLEHFGYMVSEPRFAIVDRQYDRQRFVRHECSFGRRSAQRLNIPREGLAIVLLYSSERFLGNL